MVAPRISMVVPTFTMSQDLETLTLHAITSYIDQVDEMIVVEDGGMFSVKILSLVDHYLYNKDNVGFTRNVNRGWNYSTGEYTMIVNSDTMLLEGDLNDLCIPGTVTSPVIASQHIPFLAGPFFVVPKSVRQERGMLMPEMHTYSSDSEYDKRVRDIFQTIDTVRIYHDISQTVTPAGLNTPEQQARDRAAYRKLIKEGKARG